MFGKEIKRYCSQCEKVQTLRVTMAFNIDDKDYFAGYDCPVCGYDISENDQRVVERARMNKKEINVTLY